MADHDTHDHTGIPGVGGSTDLDAIIAASAGEDIADALSGAAAPDAGNVFATIADVGGSLSSASAQLSGSDVALNTSTYTDVLSLGSLAAGTWLIVGSFQVQSTAIGVTILKLWDGTNLFASGSAVTYGAGGSEGEMIPIAALVVLGSPATVKVSGISSANATNVKKDTFNVTVAKASNLVAVKVA